MNEWTHIHLIIINQQVMVRTIDTGGAGPVSGILEARRMILSEGCEAVAVVAGDAVSSLDTEEFLKRADQGFNRSSALASPCIPHGYNRIAESVFCRNGSFVRSFVRSLSVPSLQVACVFFLPLSCAHVC